MSFSEVNKLRKAGRLKEAYMMAKNDLEADPDSLWAKRAMGWVLYAFAKDNASFERKDSFIKCLRQINATRMDKEETIYWDCVCQLVRGMIATCVRNNNDNNAFYDNLFAEFKAMPFPKRCESYSSLLQNMLRIKLTWNGFDAFCRWWDFDNFTEEDFLPRKYEEKAILPLAERAIMAYSKTLLLRQDLSAIEEWIPKLDKYAKEHPEYVYLPYYRAKLLLKLGNADVVTEELRRFVSKKKTEFWVWDLLGDATNNEDLRMVYYCKAITCKAKAEMTLTLREKMVRCLISQGLHSLAKAELDNVLSIRKNNKWANTAEIVELCQVLANAEAASSPELTQYYHKHSATAEQTLLDTRVFKGKVRKNAAGFAFVSDVFVPPFLAANLVNGQFCTGRAVKSYDKKKAQWGWKAISLSPIAKT